MSEKIDLEQTESTVAPATLSKGQRFKRHCAKRWWCWLISFIIFVIVVVIVMYVPPPFQKVRELMDLW